jgi:hypothetical protein
MLPLFGVEKIDGESHPKYGSCLEWSDLMFPPLKERDIRRLQYTEV